MIPLHRAPIPFQEEDSAFVKRFGPAPRDVRVTVNGVELHLLEWGAPDAPPVLLVHGMRGHARWFTTVGPAVGQEFRALSLDLRGHGESGHTPPYGHSVYAEDVAALVDALELHQPILLGHSMGGSVVLRATTLLGDRVRALVVVDSGLGPGRGRPAFSRPQWFGRTRPEHDEHRVFRTWQEARQRFKLRPGATVASDEMLDHLARHALRVLPDGGFAWRFDRRLQAQTAPRRERPNPAQVRCPVISIYGELSPIALRADPEGNARQFRNAAWNAGAIIEGAYHHVMVDQPDAFNDALMPLLGRVQDIR